MTERNVKVDGLTVHFTDEGDPSAEPIVMLHGGGPGSSGATNFSPCIRYFADRYRVIVPDQPGFGSSEFRQPKGSYLRLSADVMAGLLDTVGVTRAHIIGNSLGGGVALTMALDYPSLADRLVLMNPAGATVPLMSAETREMGMIRHYYDPPGPSMERMRQFAAEMAFDISRVPEAVIEARYEQSLRPSAREGMSSATKSFDPLQEEREKQLSPQGMLWTRLQDINHRALLMWGREDRAAPLDRAWFIMARLPNASLHIVPKCGHWVQIEWPRLFANVVRATFEDGA